MLCTTNKVINQPFNQADSSTLFAFLMPCDRYCSMALSHSAVCWSVVCDCGISLPNSLACLLNVTLSARYIDIMALHAPL